MSTRNLKARILWVLVPELRLASTRCLREKQTYYVVAEEGQLQLTGAEPESQSRDSLRSWTTIMLAKPLVLVSSLVLTWSLHPRQMI